MQKQEFYIPMSKVLDPVDEQLRKMVYTIPQTDITFNLSVKVRLVVTQQIWHYIRQNLYLKRNQ